MREAKDLKLPYSRGSQRSTLGVIHAGGAGPPAPLFEGLTTAAHSVQFVRGGEGPQAPLFEGLTSAAHSVQSMWEAKDLKLYWSRGSQEVGEDVQHLSCIFPGTLV